MIPVRTRASNFVYLGPAPDIGDAWTERRRRGEVYMTWRPSPEERAAIADGALIELGIWAEPIPPVSLGISDQREISAIAAAIRDRARVVLKRVSRGPDSVPPGYWSVSPDVWQDLNASDALDPGNGVPTLYGRPLMEVAGLPPGSLDYVTS